MTPCDRRQSCLRWLFCLLCLGLPLRAVEFPAAAQPQLAVTGETVWLVYGRLHDASAAATPEKHSHGAPAGRMGDVWVASSPDGGTTFSTPVLVAKVPRLMLGLRRGPRIAAQGGRVTVTFIAEELLACSSDDGGKTWSGPVTVNDVATSAREGLHDLAVGPDGEAVVTWLDLRGSRTQLWSARSNDGGRTWGRNEMVYRSPDQTVCECCHPSVMFDADGNLAFLWRNAIAGARDMWMATKSRGAALAPAGKLGEGTWQLNACPMDGGRIVALGEGKFGAVWQRNGEVFASRSNGAETRVGRGKQPVAIAPDAGSGWLVVWQQGNDLVSQRLGVDPSPVKRAADGRFPSLIKRPQGGALLAYERGPKDATIVVIERL